jgi:hypothetical protein
VCVCFCKRHVRVCVCVSPAALTQMTGTKMCTELTDVQGDSVCSAEVR